MRYRYFINALATVAQVMDVRKAGQSFVEALAKTGAWTDTPIMPLFDDDGISTVCVQIDVTCVKVTDAAACKTALVACAAAIVKLGGTIRACEVRNPDTHTVEDVLAQHPELTPTPKK